MHSAPYSLYYFNTPGDITSGYSNRQITGIIAGSDYIITKRIIETNTIATESAVANYVEKKILNTVHTEVSRS
jgi:hypothetical protein